jgi:hypothetical protein
MKKGYLKLWRSTLDHKLIKNPYASQVFLWMILKARWTPGRDQGIDLKPGELVTSMPTIQIELGLSEKETRAALAILRGLQVIVCDRAHDGRGLGRGKKTVFRFINWDKHQSENTEGQTLGRESGHVLGGGRAEVEENSHTEQAFSDPKKDKKERTTQAAKLPSVSSKAFTDYFWAKHLKAHSQKPMPAVWAFKQCAKVVETLGLSEAQRRCDNFFSDPYLKTHALEDFIKAPDKWIELRIKLNTDSKADTQVKLDRKKTAV